MLISAIIVHANDMKNTIEATNVLVRKWQKDDVQALVILGKDKNMRKAWEYSYPYTSKKAADCIRFFLHANPHRYAIYAVLINQRLCGWIQARVVYYQCAEMSFWLKDKYQSCELLRELFTQMSELSFAALDILTIYTKTTMDQHQLQQALIQAGFFENNETVPIYLYYLHAFTFFNRHQNKLLPPALDSW